MWKLVCAKDPFNSQLLPTLNDHKGRQIWVFDESAGTPELIQKVEELRTNFSASRLRQAHSADELLRLQCAPAAVTSARRPLEKLPDSADINDAVLQDRIKGAISFHELLQQDDGHWPGDYGGPMFLMPGLIIALYTTGDLHKVLSQHHVTEMLRYLRNHQNEDGGFGLHIEGHSTMFGTGLSYVAARILGVQADDDLAQRARAWIHSRGGATYITSWGKFWLAVLGVYSWDGMNPLPPEMWLLPHSKLTGIGFAHPGRFWCHCRMVYLPMSYIYACRGTSKDTTLTAALREELYPCPYDSIDWNAARSQCAKEDLYYPHPLVQDMVWWALYQVEPLLMNSWLRKKAMQECMVHIHYEDENTRYIDIGPVNKVLNLLCCWLEDPNSQAYKKHLTRVPDYLWVAEDGMKMQGYNGSQLWDTAFAVQALAATGLSEHAAHVLRKAHQYIEASQVVTEADPPLSRYYRHISEGAWPFSTRDHGWPISDCSSEGLKAALVLAGLDPGLVGAAISDERLCKCVDVILSYQNSDGGMATYENTRSLHALEILNPSETFGDIMVDYSYVECTSACITALSAFAHKFPAYRKADVARCLDRAEAFIRKIQRPDGSWYGSWAVCFTYGMWFGTAALAARGYDVDSDDALTRAALFLTQRQRDDGGWGESYLSSQDKVYVQLKGESHVVNTAWAMISLMNAGYHRRDPSPLHAAARCLLRQQLPSGDWPQQTISGVFNKNCMITYANYRNIFPIWALGMYRRLVCLGESS